MARAPDERYDQAKAMYQSGQKLVEIASQLNLPEGTVRRWKSTHKWDNERSDKKSERSDKKKGGQPGNKNAVGNAGGSPIGNKRAEKYGFFSKYLPEETREIFNAIDQADPLDLLWHQIQIAYAAIIRAQRIGYAKSKGEWLIQSDFMKSQARAQGELRAMIKQYDEMLHRNWDMATEEQRVRIDVMKAKAKLGDVEDVVDDGFLEALNGSAAEDWADEEES